MKICVFILKYLFEFVQDLTVCDENKKAGFLVMEKPALSLSENR